MDLRNPAIMTPDEMVLEMRELQKGISRGALRIHELSKFLHHRVRRSPSDETTGIYITYANALGRFSGMVQQGVVRLRSAERVLGMLPKDEDKAAPPPPPPSRTPASSKAERSAFEDLIDLYGEETLNAAERA
jgi:hypothetical protein